MNNLTHHQRLVLKRARLGWQTQRQLHTSRTTISTLMALGLLRRKFAPGKHLARPEDGSFYKAAEAA